MVHLHNGILCSREKEGAYTLCNSMDETGEHEGVLENQVQKEAFESYSELRL